MDYLYKLGSYVYESLPSLRNTSATPKPTMNVNPEPAVISVYAGGYVVVNVPKVEAVVPDAQKAIQDNKDEVARVQRKQAVREQTNKRKALEQAMFGDADGKVAVQPDKKAKLNHSVNQRHSVGMFKQATTTTPQRLQQPGSGKSRRCI